MSIKKLFTAAMVTMSVTSFAQNVGVNTDGLAPDGSALLDVILITLDRNFTAYIAIGFTGTALRAIRKIGCDAFEGLQFSTNLV